MQQAASASDVAAMAHATGATAPTLSVDMRLPAQPPQLEVVQIGAQERPIDRRGSDLGHEAVQMHFLRCDDCNTSLCVASNAWSCAPCDRDLCERCVNNEHAGRRMKKYTIPNPPLEL